MIEKNVEEALAVKAQMVVMLAPGWFDSEAKTRVVEINENSLQRVVLLDKTDLQKYAKKEKTYIQTLFVKVAKDHRSSLG